MNNPETSKKIDDYYAAAEGLKTETRDYIMGLKDKGVSQTLINKYVEKLDSLSDGQIMENADKYKFSDTDPDKQQK